MLRPLSTLLLAHGLVACGLFVDLSGYTGGGGEPSSDGGSTSADATATFDATTPPPPPPPPPGDAGGDADAATIGYAEVVKADGPIAYWRLRESSGTVAKDEMGAHDATYVGTVSFQQAGPSATVPSVRFNGTGHLSADAVAQLPAGTFASYTIEMLVASAVPPGTSSFLMGFSAADGTGGPVVFVDDTTQKFRFVVNGAITDSPTALGTSFHHLAVTATGGVPRIYLDGVLSVTGTSTNTTPSNVALTIGGDMNGTNTFSNAFSGSLCEVAIYGKALSQAQIAAHVAARP